MKKFRKGYLLKHFLVPTIIYLSGVVVYIIWNSYSDHTQITREVDTRLLQAAGYVKYILPDDFHDRATDNRAVSDSENRVNIDRLTEYARAVGLTYLYTVVIENDKVYFTSSSASAKDIREKNLPTYWQDYPEATKELKNTFTSNAPTFETSKDRWGTFRSALMRETSCGGKKYLVGADMDVSFVRAEVIRRIPFTLMRALFFLIIVLPIFFATRKFYLKSTQKLQIKINERRQAEKELEEYSGTFQSC